MTETLLDYKIARQEILARVTPGPTEKVALNKAPGRILAQDLVAQRDLPGYDNSAMDGFALRSAEADAGVELKIAGEVAAGAAEAVAVKPGTVVRIMTGAMIPEGADAVIPVEDVDLEGNRVRLHRQVEKGDHIRWRGEDLAQGSLALAAGAKLSPPGVGLLASLGHDSPEVYRRPRVAVLATGSELQAPGQLLEGAQIYDSNSAALCAAVGAAGGEPVPLGIARDDRASLKQMISAGLEADVLVTAAGASVGEYDLVRGILGELDAEEIFWGVAIKPGKPTGFSLCRHRPVFCLPGNPVSALVTFDLFVRPALRRMTGRRPALPGTVRLPLREPLKKKKARTLFARIRLVSGDDGLQVASAGSQQTGIMSSLVHADGLAVLPAGKSDFAVGEHVEVVVFCRD